MRYIVTILLTSLIFTLSFDNVYESGKDDAWEKADSILAHIKEPVFQDKTFNILDFGAIADGKTLNTKAIKNAIDECHTSGGGKVVVPEGTFLTGTIHLKNNVNLYLSKNSVLLFSLDPKDYLPVVLTRWEGIDCYNYSPLIYACEQENIAITGEGKLDGQANSENWWIWKGRTEYGWKPGILSQLIPEGRPLLLSFEQNKTPIEERVMGEGHYLRPQFINFYKCSNILLEDFTITNSPFWLIHPLFSNNITVRGLHIDSHGPNNDGCNPESSKMMLIEECHFNTGDDCIAIKSGRNYDGRKWNIPTKEIVIRNNFMENGHGGVVLGSEISGGVNNIFVEDCKMNSPELERAIRIKTNALRGGVVEDLYFRNLEIGEVTEAVIKINCLYEITEDEKGGYPPLIKDIYITDINSEKAEYAVFMAGIENIVCIKNINISNSNFKGVKKDNYLKNTDGVYFHNVRINEKEFNVSN